MVAAPTGRVAAVKGGSPASSAVRLSSGQAARTLDRQTWAMSGTPGR
jgi:hypothetical protein